MSCRCPLLRVVRLSLFLSLSLSVSLCLSLSLPPPFEMFPSINWEGRWVDHRFYTPVDLNPSISIEEACHMKTSTS